MDDLVRLWWFKGKTCRGTAENGRVLELQELHVGVNQPRTGAEQNFYPPRLRGYTPSHLDEPLNATGLVTVFNPPPPAQNLKLYFTG